MSRPREAGPRAGDRILVAGAAGLVGRAVAEAAAAQGAELVLLGRSVQPLEELARQLNARHGAPALVIAADLTDPGSLDAAVKRIRASGADRLDAVVNLTTAYDGRPVPAQDLAVDEFRRVVETDLVGAFALVQACLPLLCAAPAGRVVLLSSVAALRGRPLAAHLVAAKAGVNGLGLALALELGELGIGVNVVAPGPIERPGVPHPPSPVPFSTAEQVARAVLEPAGAEYPLRGQTLVVTGAGPVPGAPTPVKA